MRLIRQWQMQVYGGDIITHLYTTPVGLINNITNQAGERIRSWDFSMN